MKTRPTRLNNRVVTALTDLGGLGNVENIDAEALRARLEDENEQDRREAVDTVSEV